MRRRFSGVWLPIVTPFVDGEIDYLSYERLVDHYVGAGVNGIIPLGTTGESPTIDEAEADTLIERTVAAVDGRVPIVVGVSGNDTRKVVGTVKRLERYRIDGLLALAELPNVVGVKDSSGDVAQSLALLRRRPEGFSVLTGEDAYFYTMLAHGGDGGILASAHLETETFLAVYERMAANDHHGARALWSALEPLIPLLFTEPNPMPVKHCLWRQGLIRSAECRLPMTRVSPALAHELETIVGDIVETEARR